MVGVEEVVIVREISKGINIVLPLIRFGERFTFMNVFLIMPIFALDQVTLSKDMLMVSDITTSVHSDWSVGETFSWIRVDMRCSVMNWHRHWMILELTVDDSRSMVKAIVMSFFVVIPVIFHHLSLDVQLFTKWWLVMLNKSRWMGMIILLLTTFEGFFWLAVLSHNIIVVSVSVLDDLLVVISLVLVALRVGIRVIIWVIVSVQLRTVV